MTFESGIVGISFGDVGAAGKVAPCGRKFIYGLRPSPGVNGVVREELGIGDWGLGIRDWGLGKVAPCGRKFFIYGPSAPNWHE